MSPEPGPDPAARRMPLDDQFARDVVAILRTTLTMAEHALRARHPAADAPVRAADDPAPAGLRAARLVLDRIRTTEAALRAYEATLAGDGLPPTSRAEPAPQAGEGEAGA